MMLGTKRGIIHFEARYMGCQGAQHIQEHHVRNRGPGINLMARNVLAPQTMVRQVSVLFIVWILQLTINFPKFLESNLEHAIRAVIDVMGAMHLQTFTSIGGSHPRTNTIREDDVCHHRTRSLRVQVVCMAL